MFLVWKGRGLIVPALIFVLYGILYHLFKTPEYDYSIMQRYGYSFIIASFILWPLGKYWNKDCRERIAEMNKGDISWDKKIENIFENYDHTFLFIPIEYWSVLLIILVIVFQFI